MTDEQQVRSLLMLAADLPGDVDPPVGALLHRGRRRRRLRAAGSVAVAAVAAAAAFTVPAILRAPADHPPTAAGPGVRPPAGPAAAEIAHFRWSALPRSPLGQRSGPLLAWTGRYLIELGGTTNGTERYDGAVFDPATRRWHRMAPIPNTVGLPGAVAVWTGRQLFVTDDRVPSWWAPGVGAPAALYDPARNSWSGTDMPVQLLGSNIVAAWTGRVIVVASVDRGQVRAGAYDPVTRRWRMISPTLPAGHPARYLAMTALPSRLLIWSMWDRVTTYRHGLSDRAGVDVLSAGRDGGWHVVTGRWPQNVFVPAPVFTGTQIMLPPAPVWCGQRCIAPSGTGPGNFADPATLSLSAIPPGPLAQAGPAFIWTGHAIIAIDLYSEITGPGSRRIREDDMALYDPRSGRWRNLAAPPGYPSLAVPPLWAGRRLIALTDGGQVLSFHR